MDETKKVDLLDYTKIVACAEMKDSARVTFARYVQYFMAGNLVNDIHRKTVERKRRWLVGSDKKIDKIVDPTEITHSNGCIKLGGGSNQSLLLQPQASPTALHCPLHPPLGG